MDEGPSWTRSRGRPRHPADAGTGAAGRRRRDPARRAPPRPGARASTPASALRRSSEGSTRAPGPVRAHAARSRGRRRGHIRRLSRWLLDLPTIHCPHDLLATGAARSRSPSWATRTPASGCPALQVLAKRHGWTITTFLASRCNATDARLELWGGTAGCHAYGQWVLDRTKGDAFDLVITSERQSVAANGEEDESSRAAAEDGYRSYLKKWSQAGTNVLSCATRHSRATPSTRCPTASPPPVEADGVPGRPRSGAPRTRSTTSR